MIEVPSHSSVLSGLTYDPERQLLWVRFRTGDYYLYHMVPMTVVQELTQAQSQGQYFNLAIRENFTYSRLS